MAGDGGACRHAFRARGRQGQRIDRVLTIEGAVDDEQKKRMADIAERTPVTLTLKGGLEIRTQRAASALIYAA